MKDGCPNHRLKRGTPTRARGKAPQGDSNMGKKTGAVEVSIVHGYRADAHRDTPLSAANSIENICFIIRCVINNDADNQHAVKLPDGVIDTLRRIEGELRIAAKSVRYDECRAAMQVMATRAQARRSGRRVSGSR